MGRFSFRLAAIAGLVLVAALLGAGSAVGVAPPQHLKYPSAQCPKGSTGLNDCIAGATAGSTITVSAGTYYESGTAVGKAVTVAGSSCAAGKVVIDQGFAGDGFDVAASNVTIQCMTIRHGGSNYDGIYSNGTSDNLHVSKVVLLDQDYGVYQNQPGSSGTSITNSTISAIDSYGIFVAAGATGGVISADTILNVGSECFDLGGMTNGTVSNNKLGPCGSIGVEIDAGANNVISGNTLTAIDSDCIYVAGTFTTITKNTLNGCNSDAVYVSGNNATVTFNKVIGQVDGNTFDLSCSDNAVVSNNTSTGGNDDDNFIYVCQNSSGTETITNNIDQGGLVDDGIYCSTCDGAIISGNKILGGGEGSAFSVTGAHPIVTGNTGTGGWDGTVFSVSCTASCNGSSVSKNTESGSNGSYGFSIDDTGCAAFPCMTIDKNTATGNYEDGFYLTSHFASITGNKSSFNGYAYTGCTYAGFTLGGDHDLLSKNSASNNACLGFYVNSPSSTVQSNTATGNTVHGFQILSDATVVDKNSSTGNHGDGFNNDGTNAVFTSNKASGNRQDCTNDATGGETATIATNTGNSCKDGTNFAVTSTMTGW
jgi:parallel beta-helix repeat protein